MKVIATTTWKFGQDNRAMGGLIGQVTACEHEGVKFFVRENVTALPSFEISSGERWGDKRGAKPAPRRQSLELFLPPQRAHHWQCWQELAAVVKSLDPLGRPVLPNRNFNKTFILKLRWIEVFSQT